jgi:signal transduction histidine kinase
VSDQGPGIPDDVAGRIFEPFFTTKSGKETGGLGLGLSISKGLVAAMGGDLRFRSHGHGGTTFELRLPLNNPQNANPEHDHE